MKAIGGFEIERVLFQGRHSLIYRATRKEESAARPVVLKALASEYPEPAAIERLKREHELLRRLESAEGVIRSLGLVEEGNRHVLVLEDLAGASLRELDLAGALALDEFLRLATRIARAVAGVHEQRVVHKDLNPGNIVWNRETDELRIIDFNIAREVLASTNTVLPSVILEGTLPYVSPEQTGRINRSVDTRSDLYSLGATLHELLTGAPPFPLSDVMELVHAHIARRPPAPHELRSEVPRPVSDIVAKLLAKRPEDRYQTAAGLADDLEECFRRLETDGVIEPFELARTDLDHVFRIPERLYGREEEVARLERALDALRETGESGLALVAGGPGSGKSSVVQELAGRVIKAGGHFAAGKFHQADRNTPYVSFVRAFGDLVRQLLASSAEVLDFWRSRLLDALGHNAGVVVELLPELELLLGEQPPVQSLPANEAQNRFNFTLLRFVGALTSRDHALVLFLDDLQWADAGSLRLIELIMTDTDVGDLLLVGAWRDNEVGEWHPLRETLRRVDKAGRCAARIDLEPLGVAPITALLADALGASRERVEELAGLVGDKTGGNPFFVNQFLRSLYEGGALGFDPASARWRWDVEGIRRAGITDNVADLLLGRFESLSPGCRELLTLAACFGTDFDAGTLARIAGVEVGVALARLQEAVQQGLLVQVGQFGAPLSGEGGAGSVDIPRDLAFAHDRIREAAESLIDDEQRRERHLAIGRSLRAAGDEGGGLDLFAVVHHLDAGRHGVTDPDERLDLARLNLEAARASRRSLAIRTASEYLEVALELLPVDAWSSRYDLALELHQAAGDCAQLAGDFDGMTRHGGEVLAHARTTAERLRVFEIRASYYHSQRRPVDSVDTCLEGLRLAGIRIPRRPGLPAILSRFLALRWKMRRVETDRLAELPMMESEEALGVVRLIRAAATATYLTEPKLVPVLAFKLVEVTLEHGLHPIGAYGLCAYGFVLAGPFKKLDAGYAIARAALDLLPRFGSTEGRPSVEFLFYSFVAPWKLPIRAAFDAMLAATDVALENGNTEEATLCRHLYFGQALWGGLPLAEVDRIAEQNIRLMSRFTQEWFHRVDLFMWYGVCLLSGDSAAFERHAGPDYDPEEFRRSSEELGDRSALAIHHTMLVMAHNILGDVERAEELALAGEPYHDAIATSTFGAEFVFHHALALLAAGRSRGGLERKALAAVKRDLADLERYAVGAACNFEGKAALVATELARCQDGGGELLKRYQGALELARRDGFVQEEALCAERMADLLRDEGLERAAIGYARDALQAWRRWGAAAPAERLLAEWPSLTAAPSTGVSATLEDSLVPTVQSTTGRQGEGLDLLSVLKASRAISGEIVLDALIERMMRIVLENAGAQRGLFLLQRKGTWFLQAEHGIDAAPVDAEPQPLESQEAGQRLAAGIVRYVLNTMEPVVLDDASGAPDFASDRYVRARQPRSVLCQPILSQGEAIGVVYLENNDTTHAFTRDRVEVLQVLSSQAAVSMQNALLFEGRELLVRAYERFVPREFLSFLEKDSIIDVELGDQVEQEMTVLFTDIRSFTSLSERMTPQENFRFINAYLSAMEPVIHRHGGFIDKYIGDAIMALFPGSADDAVRGAVAMVQELARFNEERQRAGAEPIRIGIGLNTGMLMLGTVGGQQRMDGTVISDAVNLASRIEGLTKTFGTSILLSDSTRSRLPEATARDTRAIGRVRVKGKSRPVELFEAFGADPAEAAAVKRETAEELRRGWTLLEEGEAVEAARLLGAVLERNPADPVARLHRERLAERAG